MELIFNDVSSDRLGRHTEKSSNFSRSKIVLKVLFQKLSRNIYAGTTLASGKLEQSVGMLNNEDARARIYKTLSRCVSRCAIPFSFS